jgi:hypothetical protein
MSHVLGNQDGAVSDVTFFEHVERLKELHYFLYQEAVPITPSDASSLKMGNLRALYYDKDGRPPTAEEWNQVESQTQAIFIFLSPALRRKFLMTGTPSIVLWMPVYLLSIAVISIVIPVATFNWGWLTTLILIFYLVWLGSLGAVGALAYVGMNALSIQDDVTFDLSSVRLITLRVVLGALFAVVLTLPFGYSNFIDFCRYLATYNGSQPHDILQQLTAQALSLLLPFVLGFSTPSVILILNQLVEAVQTFFGRRQGSTDTAFVGITPADRTKKSEPESGPQIRGWRASMRIAHFGLLLVVQLSALSFESLQLAHSQNVLTSEEFKNTLTTCAAQQNISVDSDVITSIANIYADPVARSALSDPSVFIALMPDKDRVALYKLYIQCIKGVASPDLPPPPQATVTYKVCTGEYENKCQTHDKYFYCYADVEAWAKSLCASYKIQRVATYGGNKCGYSLDTVICTGPK